MVALYSFESERHLRESKQMNLQLLKFSSDEIDNHNKSVCYFDYIIQYKTTCNFHKCCETKF